MRYLRRASCFLRPLSRGALPGMEAADANPFAYISNGGSNTVAVIDTAAHTVVATVPGGSSLGGVVVNPAGTFGYAANEIPKLSR